MSWKKCKSLFGSLSPTKPFNNSSTLKSAESTLNRSTLRFLAYVLIYIKQNMNKQMRPSGEWVVSTAASQQASLRGLWCFAWSWSQRFDVRPGHTIVPVRFTWNDSVKTFTRRRIALQVGKNRMIGVQWQREPPLGMWKSVGGVCILLHISRVHTLWHLSQETIFGLSH